MSKKKFKISNSPIVGLISMLAVNLIAIFLLLNISRYISFQKDIFMWVIAGLIGIVLIVNFLFAIGFGYRKAFARKLQMIVSVLLVLSIGFGGLYIKRLNESFDALINKDNQEIVEYSFVTMNQGQSLDNLFPETKIGYVAKDDSFNESIEQEIQKHSTTVKVETYDTYHDLLYSMLTKEDLDVALLPKEFVTFAESMEAESREKLEHAIVLDTFNIKIEGEGTATAKVLEDPFSILMIGINDNLSDSVILLTVNPQTLHVTMTSIARDLYVPIACYPGNAPDKLNHSRRRSRQCLIDTVEDVFDLDINYYFETDFFALVKIVDVLGGLELENSVDFGHSLPLEDNPNELEYIKVPAGKYVMNGKQVITFARERKSYPNGDFQRQLNQQYIIKELALKIMDESKKNVETLIQVLKAAEDNIVMNLSMERDIAPLAGFAINNIAASPVDPMSTFMIHNTQITGSTPMVGKMSVIVPYRKSLEDNKKIIHDNLSTEIKKPEQKRFGFSINEPYKFPIDTKPSNYWGGEEQWPNGKQSKKQDTSKTTAKETPKKQEAPKEEIKKTMFTVPNLTTKGFTLAKAKEWGKTHGVAIEVRVIDPSHSAYQDNYDDGQIINQTVDAGQHDTKPKKIVLSVVNKVVAEAPTEQEE